MTSLVIHKNKKTGVQYAYSSTCKRDPITKKPRSFQKYLGIWDPDTKTITPTNRNKKHIINDVDSISKKITPASDSTSSDSISSDRPFSDSQTAEIHIANIHDFATNVTNNFSEVNETSLTNDDLNNTKFVSSKLVGHTLLLDLLTHELNILPLLKRIFPLNFSFILSIIYYNVATRKALYKINSWSLNHDHPYQDVITGPRISEFLLKLSFDEIQNFMYLWLKNLNEEDYLYYDITSISTYSKNNHLAMRGYNRDHEKLDQINLSLLVGHQTMLPAHFQTLRGNISVVDTLEKTFEYLNFFDVKNPTFVLDRGFYSKENITYLLNNSFNFLISSPSNSKWLENIIDKYYDMIKLPNHRFHLGEGETIFCARHIMRWFDSINKIYVHIFYQHDKVNLDYHDFLNNINRLKEQLEQGCKLDSYLKRNFIKYLIIHKINKKPVKVVYNNDEILKYQKKYCGFFFLLSPNIKNTHDALKIYRDRDHFEKAFDDLKNNLDLKHLRIHDSERLEAKIFIEFLTLIYLSKLRKLVRECTTSLKYLSFDEIFDALNGLIVTKHEGNKKVWCNVPDGYAKLILDYFNIAWPPR